MKKATKVNKAMEFLAKYVAENNPTVSEEQVKEAVSSAPTTSHALSMQAEAVLLCLEKPARFTMKICRNCGEPFGTNYRYVSYCSDHCRFKTLQKETGIPWNPHKSDEERWGGEAPLLIPPMAVKKLLPFAQRILELAEQAPKNSGRLDYLQPIQVQTQIETLNVEILVPQPEEVILHTALQDQYSAYDTGESNHQLMDETQASPDVQPPPLVPHEQIQEDYPFDF